MNPPSKWACGDATPMAFDLLAGDHEFHLQPHLRLLGPAEATRSQ
ncbi:hypothetical protein [Paraburkholderia sediminicola]